MKVESSTIADDMKAVVHYVATVRICNSSVITRHQLRTNFKKWAQAMGILMGRPDGEAEFVVEQMWQDYFGPYEEASVNHIMCSLHVFG